MTGAGDVVLTFFGLMAIAGLSFASAAAIANLAAGIEVGRIGTEIISRDDMALALKPPHEYYERKILSGDELGSALERDRRAGHRIVFTNGCFDLVHAGHLHLLGFARAQGDLWSSDSTAIAAFAPSKAPAVRSIRSATAPGCSRRSPSWITSSSSRKPGPSASSASAPRHPGQGRRLPRARSLTVSVRRIVRRASRAGAAAQGHSTTSTVAQMRGTGLLRAACRRAGNRNESETFTLLPDPNRV